MALDVYFKGDVRNHILAGMEMGLELASRSKPVNVSLVIGLLIAFRHQARSVGLLWQGQLVDQEGKSTIGIVDEVCASLGSDVATLVLEASLALRNANWQELIANDFQSKP